VIVFTGIWKIAEHWSTGDFLWNRFGIAFTSSVKVMWQVVSSIDSSWYQIGLVLVGLLWVGYVASRPDEPKQQHENKTASALPVTPPLAPLPKAPIPPPLWEVRCEFKEGANGQSVAMIVENTSDKPIPFKARVETIRVWSSRQNNFVSYSDLVTNVSLDVPRALEPDTPFALGLLGVENYTELGRPVWVVTVGKSSAICHPNMSKQLPGTVSPPEIYLLVLKIESGNRNRTQDLFVKWDCKEITLTNDPRK